MEYEESYEYLLLNFKEKITPSFFEEKLFFKLVNMNSSEPFVQIGDQVFKGKYDLNELASNLLYETLPDSENKSIKLLYLTNTINVLNLESQEVAQVIVNVAESDLCDLEFKHNYETVLSKIETGTLDINDIIATKVKSPPTSNISSAERNLSESQLIDRSQISAQEVIVLQENINIEDTIAEEIKCDENNLSDIKINEQVTNRDKIDIVNDYIAPRREPDYLFKVVSEDLPSNIDFLLLKQLYFKNFNYKEINLNIDSIGIQNCVNIQASVSNGIIDLKPIDKLTISDKEKLFNLNNFENFFPLMKLSFLVEILKKEKNVINALPQEKLMQKDEYGRMPKERYKLLKSFAKDLEYSMYVSLLNKS